MKPSRGISRARWGRASTAALAAVAGAACGGTPSTADVPPEQRVPAPRPVAEVYVLEASGGPPPDTTVEFAAGSARVVVLRHPPPDQTVFAEVAFDSASFGESGTVTATLRPRPGIYGIDLETSQPLRRATVTFKYAVHFLAPADARAAYGSDITFERQLLVGRLEGGQVVFLPSAHPATDNLRAEIPSAGSYVVSAPRAPPSPPGSS